MRETSPELGSNYGSYIGGLLLILPESCNSIITKEVLWNLPCWPPVNSN